MGSVTYQSESDLGKPIGQRSGNGILARGAKARRTPLRGAYLALLSFMVVYCARPEDWIPGLSHVPLAKITGILAIGALVFSLGHIRDRMPREIVFLFFLTVQLFAASLLSPVWAGGAFQQTLVFARVLVIFMVIIAAVSTLERLRELIFAQAISVSMIAAVAIWKGHLLLGRLEGVLEGYYADPNDMALAIIISLPLCLALLFLTRNLVWKTLWAISMLVMLYAVFLTGSRSGFLALVVVAAVSLWEFAIRGRRRYLLAVSALVGAVLLQSAGGMLVGRLKGTFNVEDDTAEAYSSAQARQQLFWRSIEITKEHPFFGVGPGNFDAVSGQWHTTHNSLTLMSSEGGVPALILYLLILWCGFKNLGATKRLARGNTESSIWARALLASLAGYAVGSFFLSAAYQFFPYILVAYTTALFSISRKCAAQSRKYETARQATTEEEVYADSPESEMSFQTF